MNRNIKEDYIKALTLHRPWGHAIIYGRKRIENRTWKPPKSIIGKFIFLHSGKSYDKKAVDFMHKLGFYPPDEKDCPLGIIGMIEITGYSRRIENAWFFGPYGWTIGGVIAFLEPIECPGKQGLWQPDTEIVENIVREYKDNWIYYL